MPTKEQLAAHFNMLWKAAAGAAIAATLGYLAGADLGPTGNLLAVVVSQFVVHLAAKYGVSPKGPTAPSVFW